MRSNRFASPCFSVSNILLLFVFSFSLLISNSAPASAATSSKLLTDGSAGADSCPRYSPDGTKIVFVRETDGKSRLWLMNADGTDQHQLIREEGRSTPGGKFIENEPSWVPDGTGIVYASNENGNYDLYMYRFNDDYSIQITQTPANERMPAVSPLMFAASDCEGCISSNRYYKIAYISDADGADDLWIMTLDGTRAIRQTEKLPGKPGHPAWSADARTIAFDVIANGKSQIMFFAPPRKYFEEEELKSSHFIGDFMKVKPSDKKIADAYRPAYSPNGMELLYVSENGRIMKSGPSGENAAAVADAAAPQGIIHGRPSWHPSGRRILCIESSAKTKSVIRASEIADPFADILNIARVKQSKPEMDALTARGFYISPLNYREFSDVYESNVYSGTPSFITTDSILHLYHIFFDYSLRRVEVDKMLPALKTLTGAMLGESLKDAADAPEELHKQAARNAVLFAVAAQLLKMKTPAALPKDVADLAKQEFDLVTAHSELVVSPAFGVLIDYSQFIPRGHYTRSDELTAYFLAMMWYSQARISIDEKIDEKKDIESSLQRIAMLVGAMERAGGDPSALELWDKLFWPASYLVGSTEDQSVATMRPVLHEIFGDKINIADLSEANKMDSLMVKAAALPRPAVAPAFGRAFMFMPQRFTPDGHILQDLVFDTIAPDVGTIAKPRFFAKGLDVMAALGSKLAEDLLINTYHEDQYENYTKQLGALKTEFAAYSEAAWKQNIYNGWIHTFMPLLDEKKEPYPAFMRSRFWGLKNLNTSLGNWTELKHDTILYAKQAYAAEGGGGWTEEVVPPEPVGYVEPEIEVYSRLSALTAATYSGLAARGILPEDLKKKFERLQSLVMFLKFMSEKELAGLAPDENDGPRIKLYGAEVESLMLSISEGVQTSLADKRAALVADVQSAIIKGQVSALEEATGDVNTIYVLVDMGGWRQICRGAVYSYYEFIVPGEDRMTDEQWQEKLDTGTEAPAPPEWIKQITVEEKQEPADGGAAAE